VTRIVGNLHNKFVFGRRVRVLADHLAAFIPRGHRVLDVGCGDGAIDCLIAKQRPDISIEGIELLVRPITHMPVKAFNGETIPYPDGSFETVMFVDALHHTADPRVLLREAARVGKMILIKDHLCEGVLADTTLRFMDWVGNAHHGVALPYNYWSMTQWSNAFNELGVKVCGIKWSLGLYPAPACWLFDRGLHFVAKLEHM